MNENGHKDLDPREEPEESFEHDEIYTVNNCNGKTDLTDHADDCDGDCGTEDVTGLMILLHRERMLWAKSDMREGGIVINGFDLSCKIDTLIKYLIEKENLDSDELDQKFRLHKIERMQEIRRGYEEAKRAVQIQAIRQPLFGPDGNPIGL